MNTLQQFIKQNKLRFSVEWSDNNPNMDLDDWSRTATHWRCTIKKGRKQLTTYFSQGSAHTEEPTLEDVLDCLASDAAGIENSNSFEEWCSEYGYDTDSRKAEKTYKICKHQAEALSAMLDHNKEAYEALLFDTERL